MIFYFVSFLFVLFVFEILPTRIPSGTIRKRNLTYKCVCVCLLRVLFFSFPRTHSNLTSPRGQTEDRFRSSNVVSVRKYPNDRVPKYVQRSRLGHIAVEMLTPEKNPNRSNVEVEQVHRVVIAAVYNGIQQAIEWSTTGL